MTRETIAFELASDVRAGVGEQSAGAPLPQLSWTFSALAIDPQQPDATATVGSTTVTGDELRFDAKTGVLRSGYLHIPDTNGNLEDWSRAPLLPLTGGPPLQLTVPSVFRLPQAQSRTFHARSATLVCVIKGAQARHADRRFEVLTDLSFLISRGRYCGWVLKNAHQHLWFPNESLPSRIKAPPPQADGFDTNWIERFFALVNNDTDAAAFDGDPNLRDDLEQLANEVRLNNSIAAHALMADIDRTLESNFLPSRKIRSPNVAVVRNLKTGQTFVAKDRDAMATRTEDLHPLVSGRAQAITRLLELVYDLNDPQFVHTEFGNSLAPGDLQTISKEHLTKLVALMNDRGIPPLVDGLDMLVQLERTNTYAQQSAVSAKQLRPLPRYVWLDLIHHVGKHAEVKAVSDALLAIGQNATTTEPRKPRSKQKARVSPPPPLAPPETQSSEIEDLELYIEKLTTDPSKAATPEPAARCAHCAFITHGVQLTPAQKEREASVAQKPR